MMIIKRSFRCGSDKTLIDKNGYIRWYKGETEDSFICNICYHKQYRLNRELTYPLIPCACKCGGLIPAMDGDGQQRRFIDGHQSRGRICSDTTKAKIRLRQIRLGRLDDKSRSWKADNVGYGGLHDWVKKHLSKPDKCSLCRTNKRLELCNISKKYNPETYNRDFKNWFYACHRCHNIYDDKLKYLKPLRPKYLGQICIHCGSAHIILKQNENHKKRLQCQSCKKSWTVSGTHLIDTFLARLKQEGIEKGALPYDTVLNHTEDIRIVSEIVVKLATGGMKECN